MPVTVEIEARLPERFLVWETLLDRLIPFELQGHTATLQFPPFQVHGPVGYAAENFSTLFMSRGDGDRPESRACLVPKLYLRIQYPLDYLVSDLPIPDGEPEDPRWEILMKAFTDGMRLGHGFLVELLTLMRTSPGQHLLGPASRQFSFHVSRIYDELGNPFPTGGGNGGDQWGLEPLSPLTMESLVDLLDRTNHREQPDLADTLMASAFFTLVSSDDARLGVLQAAIAAERRIKTFLENHANESQRALVGLITKPGGAGLAAVALYDKGLMAVVERSFREDEPRSYKQLVRLFEQRNKFVHLGDAALTREEARELVRAARTAGEYLAHLEIELTT